MSVGDAYFDELFAGNDDPWSFRQRWYERRKRALTLAALPRERFSAAFEPGCANGELAAELAQRCDNLLCGDTSVAAVRLARERLADFPHARVEQMRLPQDWPGERFDLIVFSEVGYYLNRGDLLAVAERMRDSLDENGVLLACHWRHPIEGCPLDGDEVHRLLGDALGMHSLATHLEADFILQLWSRDGLSVASREGLA
ncbi:SAM-dependent methyltransferase [Pseudomonas sp.]|uniref:class I SAM-dependent DNA methyltransferase n=1 Tax=Pseudomonas sp. TaxID=306 RepID=UPI0028AC6D3E|nr:SAM-dependent methyltransferase [Pseudomonas sp.]